MMDRNIKVNGIEDGEWRFVTNNDVSKENIDYVIQTMTEIL